VWPLLCSSEARKVIGEEQSEGCGGPLRAVLLSNRAVSYMKVCSLSGFTEEIVVEYDKDEPMERSAG
jgi:hypothetical protein